MVLLHGYLESAEIWSQYGSQIAEKFRVVRVDLPGHGLSEIPEGIPSIDKMGDETVRLLDQLGLKKVALIGHSLGGYVSLSIAERYPDRLSCFILFHSVPFTDNAEKRLNRDRGIALIRAGKKSRLVNTHAPSVFSPANETSMCDILAEVKAIAMKTKDAGIIYSLNAMKNRPGRAHVLRETRLPAGLIFGMHDRFIPVEVARNVTSINSEAMTYWLMQSGHMGFLEETDLSVAHTFHFLQKVLQ